MRLRLRMRVLLSLLILSVLSAPAVHAQQANLTVNETLTATKAVVAELHLVRSSFQDTRIAVDFQTSGGVLKRTAWYTTATNAELGTLVTALANVRATETGTDARKLNFRILGWLADNNKFKDESGATISVTLVP